MAFRYNVNKVKNTNLPEGQEYYSITTVRYSNVTLDQIAEEMNVLSSFSPGDVTGLIDNLIIVIANHLALGSTVTLDGLGTFSVSATLKHPVTDPDSITGNNIQVNRICFKPTPDFKNRVESQASFVKYEPIIKYVEKKD